MKKNENLKNAADCESLIRLRHLSRSQRPLQVFSCAPVLQDKSNLSQLTSCSN